MGPVPGVQQRTREARHAGQIRRVGGRERAGGHDREPRDEVGLPGRCSPSTRGPHRPRWRTGPGCRSGCRGAGRSGPRRGGRRRESRAGATSPRSRSTPAEARPRSCTSTPSTERRSARPGSGSSTRCRPRRCRPRRPPRRTPRSVADAAGTYRQSRHQPRPRRTAQLPARYRLSPRVPLPAPDPPATADRTQVRTRRRQPWRRSPRW